ncbi:hypothetical protein D3C80_1608790 [compost metagenome]
MLVDQPLPAQRSRHHPGVVGHFRGRHHTDAQLRCHRLGDRLTAVQLQLHPWLHTGSSAGLVEGAPGSRGGFAQHHDLLVQLGQGQVNFAASPGMARWQQRAQARFAQVLQVQALAWLNLGQHRHVGMFGQQRRQRLLRVTQPQIDRDAGVALA